jgi:hypothetical protein
MLEGCLSFPHSETRDGDEVTSHETDYEIEAPFVLLKFTCLTCLIEYDIQQDSEYELSIKLSEAQAELARLREKGNKPC